MIFQVFRRWGVHGKPLQRGLPKKDGLRQFADLRGEGGGLGKKEGGGTFEGD